MEVRNVVTQYLNNLTGVGANAKASDGAAFQNMLLDAMEQADQTDATDRLSTDALLTGEVDDIAQTVIDTQKADVALRLTVQIRNRVIDAYNEVMRMQV